MRALICIIVLILSGCDDPVVSTNKEKIGQKIERSSCSLGPGYCMECGLNINGSFDCLPKFKHNCHGSQEALFDVYKVTNYHKSGAITYSEKLIFLEEKSVCQ